MNHQFNLYQVLFQIFKSSHNMQQINNSRYPYTHRLDGMCIKQFIRKNCSRGGVDFGGRDVQRLALGKTLLIEVIHLLQN